MWWFSRKEADEKKTSLFKKGSGKRLGFKLTYLNQLLEGFIFEEERMIGRCLVKKKIEKTRVEVIVSRKMTSPKFNNHNGF